MVVPDSLRPTLLKILHAGHAGVQAMVARASQTVYWPNYIEDIERTRATCTSCAVNAPSNPAQVPMDLPDLPQYPFQVICTDFMDWNGHSYMVIVDKYSNWLSIFKLGKDNSKNVIQVLRQYFSVFGVAECVCSDGAAVYCSQEMKQFFNTWKIVHRVSSAYHPTSNKRAEVAVKSAKRLIRENVGPASTLNTNQVVQALLSHRNCPDPATGVSPAQIVFGREIRDIIPRSSYKPRKAWSEMAEARESSFLKRHYAKSEIARPQRKLKELCIGDNVHIQDQQGTTPHKWSKSGVIVDSLPFNSYLVKVDGSSRLTKRNRQFLRKFVPFQTSSNASSSINDANTPSDLPTVSNCSIPQLNRHVYHHLMDAPITLAVALMTSSPYALSTLMLQDFDLPLGGIQDSSSAEVTNVGGSSC